VARTVGYIALLGLVLAAVAAAAGFVAAQRYGNGAYQASAAAALVNWIAGGAALTIIALSANKPWRVNAGLLAMLVRMSIPLVALVGFTQTRNTLSVHGVSALIVVLYLVGLLVETLMTVRMLSAAETLPVASQCPIASKAI
jgi:hypothetical protein